jgi:outer membrane putative beta-barrel porin/alpha-amylase
LTAVAKLRVAGFFLGMGLGVFPCQGQDLAPRAYVITPIHSNAVVLTYSYFNGGILFDPTIPITNASAQINVSACSLFHTLSFFGRSASLTATLPYGVGNFEGQVTGAPTEGKLYRSGLLDATFRFSVNLKGGPAMSVREFAKWQQKTLLGASFTMVAPTGQYDPTRLINQGANRWAFKPELGLSRRWGHWVVDAYGAGWFFTANNDFFSRNQFSPGTNTKTQAPIVAIETHLSRDFRPRLWVSLDGNFWHGGQSSINGVEKALTVQNNSRVGVTASVPLGKHESVKFSYNRGAYVQVGGDYQNVSIGWQYSWFGRPN